MQHLTVSKILYSVMMACRWSCAHSEVLLDISTKKCNIIVKDSKPAHEKDCASPTMNETEYRTGKQWSGREDLERTVGAESQTKRECHRSTGSREHLTQDYRALALCFGTCWRIENGEGARGKLRSWGHLHELLICWFSSREATETFTQGTTRGTDNVPK